jgi:hypothetical protein
MATLPRQGSATGQYWSLARDSQLRDELEAAFLALHGVGIVAGGQVTKTGALEVTLEANTGFAAEGKVHLETDALLRSGFADGTAYLYGLVTRTAADQSDQAALDTYAAALTHNDTGVAPSAQHVPLAILTITAGDITAIDNDPPGKWLRFGSQRGWRSVSAAGSGTLTLTAAQARDTLLKLTGVLTGARTVVFPPDAGRLYLVRNATTGGFSLTAKVSGGTGEVVPPGETRFLYVDDTDVVVLDPADLGAAAASHTHTAAQVSDFAEAVDDRVDALVVDGLGITSTYNDGAGTLTLALSSAAEDALGGLPLLTAGAEAADAIQVTIQVRDFAGNNLAERREITVILTDTQYGAETATAPDTGVTIDTGTVRKELTAGKQWRLLTDASGVAQLTISHAAGAATWYVEAALNGRVGSVAATFA